MLFWHNKNPEGKSIYRVNKLSYQTPSLAENMVFWWKKIHFFGQKVAKQASVPTALPKKSAALLWQDNDMLIAKQKSNLVCWVYFYWHNPYQRHIYLEVWANPKRIGQKIQCCSWDNWIITWYKKITFTLRLFEVIETKFWPQTKNVTLDRLILTSKMKAILCTTNGFSVIMF